ncbi:MAG: tRNA 2-selenouridine(34) synthase MnmH, partial [Chlorobi bacterium]|nr:tRNA 2-selenouridine(34) synthase MnmH [Chlorobiota bacterium]
GFDVLVLRGGYKAFRRWALATFARPHRFIIISGYTGSGKTELLQQLAQRGESTLDFEQLASHRGSAFGSLGLGQQPTQQQFENALALELWKHRSAERIWIEDESRRVGMITIPDGIWTAMQSAPIIALDIPLEHRIERLVTEYGAYSPSSLAQSLHAIRERLGTERYTRALEALERGDMKTVARLALEHYDKAYRHSLRKRAHRVCWLTAASSEVALNELLDLASLQYTTDSQQ